MLSHDPSLKSEMKIKKGEQKPYGFFAGTHIDYNLSRQLLQYLLSFNLIKLFVQIDSFEKIGKKQLKCSTKNYSDIWQGHTLITTVLDNSCNISSP